MEHTLHSGVTVEVVPLSSFTMSKISQKAKDLHPDLDSSQFDTSDPYSSYGGVIPGEHTPGYKTAQRNVVIERNIAYKRMAFLMGVKPPPTTDEAQMIEQFSTEIQRTRALLDLGDTHEWEILVLYILVTLQDEKPVTDIITSLRPVAMRDVVSALPFSRAHTKAGLP